MATQTYAAIPEGSVVTAGFVAAQASLARQSHAFLRAYGNMFEIYDGAVHAWLERQRAGIDSALAAAEKIAEAGNGQDAVRIYSDWLVETLKRFNEDILKLGEQIATVPSKTIAALQAETAVEAHEQQKIRIAGTESSGPTGDGAEQRAAG